jgi:hypothetical protein
VFFENGNPSKAGGSSALFALVELYHMGEFGGYQIHAFSA